MPFLPSGPTQQPHQEIRIQSHLRWNKDWLPWVKAAKLLWTWSPHLLHNKVKQRPWRSLSRLIWKYCPLNAQGNQERWVILSEHHHSHMLTTWFLLSQPDQAARGIKGDSRNLESLLTSLLELTVAIAVADPTSPGSAWGPWVSWARLFYNSWDPAEALLESSAFRLLHTTITTSTSSRKSTIIHTEDARWCQNVCVGSASGWPLSWGLWWACLTSHPSGLHGRQQLQDVSVVGPLLVVHYLELGKVLFMPSSARWARVVRDCPFLGATWHLWSQQRQKSWILLSWCLEKKE